MVLEKQLLYYYFVTESQNLQLSYFNTKMSRHQKNEK
jgi:outer membrane receptor for Fe3+-dicitrate